MGRKPRITPPFGLQVRNFERPLASEGADPRLVPHAGAKNPAIRRFQAQYRPMANGNVIDIETPLVRLLCGFRQVNRRALLTFLMWSP